MPTLQRQKDIIKTLNKLYPNAHTALNYSTPWELLVGVILSAQCTDVRVNIVTEKLFKKYKTIKDYAEAPQKEFEKDIHSTGFYRNKAKNIIATANIVLRDFNGQVPDTMEDLLKLRGVARKTANVILNEAFDKNVGVVVDTHVIRLSNRLGLTQNTDPKKIEQDLMKQFDQKDWKQLSMGLVLHGRQVCIARKPACDKCALAKVCPSAFKFEHFSDHLPQ